MEMRRGSEPARCRSALRSEPARASRAGRAGHDRRRAGNARAPPAPSKGQVTWGVHVSLAPTWFDPAETSGIITPYMMLYALHDAVVKPMPGKPIAPSLAEVVRGVEGRAALRFRVARRRSISTTAIRSPPRT